MSLYFVEHHKKAPSTPNPDKIKNPSISDESLIVNLTGPEWNTLIDAVIELDKNLKSIGLGGDDSGPWP